MTHHSPEETKNGYYYCRRNMPFFREILARFEGMKWEIKDGEALRSSRDGWLLKSTAQSITLEIPTHGEPV